MQQIDIDKLKSHPRNNDFFDDMSGEKWNEFLESIKSRGVIEPIVITPDKVIVSGHQRVRACKELGIDTVMCDVHTYNNEDEILQDLLETNIRQRGNIGGSDKKISLRIKELERIYGIRDGSRNAKGSNMICEPKNSADKFTQSDLAVQMGMSVDTLQNYKRLADMIPELEELIDTGIVTKSTALAMIKNLSEDEQLNLIASLDTTKKITKKEMQRYIDKIKKLEEDNEKVISLENQISNLKAEKGILERKVRLTQEDSDRYKKLKSDIEFLTKRKSDIGRQIDSATELAGLTVKLQKLLEGELAPIKFKRCMERLDSSDICVEILREVVERIDSWVNEMKKILGNKYEDIIDV